MAGKGSREFMYVEAAADRLCCSKGYVYELIKAGKLEAIRLGKCGIRVSAVSVQAFIDQSKISPEDYRI